MIRIIIHILIFGVLILTNLLEPLPAWYAMFFIIFAIIYLAALLSMDIYKSTFGFFIFKKLKTKHGNYYYEVNANSIIVYQEYYYWILYEHSKLDEYESTQDVLEFLKNQAGYINFVYAEKEHKKKIKNQIKEELSTWK